MIRATRLRATRHISATDHGDVGSGPYVDHVSGGTGVPTNPVMRSVATANPAA
jgi:hypothetical protein